MADMTLEEALAAATVDEELVTPVNEVLLINPETRTINVPDSEKLFGVRQDMSVERKYFKCPRIVGDNIDLFEHYVFVNYIPSDQNGKYESEKDVQGYWCKDLAVEGDFITFSWELTENVLRKAGYIAFAVYAKVSDENGNLKTKWHTTIAIGNVLDTLPDGEEWITVYPDIVMQLLERMDEVEKIATEEAMQGYVDDYFNRNPMMIDRELKDETKAAPADIVGKLSEDIADLKENGTGTGSGATTAQANSLWAFLKKTAFTKPLTDAEINEFKTTWGITEEVEPDTPTTYTITRNLTNCTSSSEVTSISEGLAHTETITANNGYTLTGATVSVTMGDSDITSSYSNGVLNISSVTGNIVLTVSAVQETTEPDNPEVTLTSISATYTGGEVAVGTSVNSLTGITVKAHYSDGTSKTVSGYTLIGTIAEGSNTVTVSYNGVTTTFTVTGVAEEPDEPVTTLSGYQITEFGNVYADRDAYTQWKWNGGIANRFTYTTKLFPSGTYWIRSLLKNPNSSSGYTPVMYQTEHADWLTTKSGTPTAITEDSFVTASQLGDNDANTWLGVQDDGSFSFVGNNAELATGFVYLKKITIPEGYYGILTIGSDIASNVAVYVENWITVFNEDPTDNITCTEVTE